MRQILSINPCRVVCFQDFIADEDKVYVFCQCVGDLYKIVKVKSAEDELYAIVCISDSKKYWGDVPCSTRLADIVAFILSQGEDVYEFDSIFEAAQWFSNGRTR